MLCITYTLLLVLGVALKRDPAQSIAFYHELHEKAALAHLEQPALAHLDDQTPTTPTVPTVAAAPAKPFLDLQTPTTPTELANLATKPGAPLAGRASCHDMAAAGECDTNKVYMLSQCVLACQAAAAGGVAARPAPAAAASVPVTKPHLGLHAPTIPTGTELAHLAAKPAPLATKPAPLAGRASCHDMAAAGECDTNKVYMLSQCVLACQAAAAGGVAARPAPAAAAVVPVTKPHLGLHAPTTPTETPSVPAVASVPAKVHLKAAEPASVPEVI
jgi:hypothetical protein